MKKIYTFLTVFHFTVMFFLAPQARLIAQTATAPSAGDGTAGNPYQIATLENLYWISVNNATVYLKYFIQTADIDASTTSSWFSGAGWIPIGITGGTNFYGSYNGQGHVISNLYINRPATANVGLFNFTGHSTGTPSSITNLGLTSVNISGGTGTGAIVGYAQLTSISNCYSTGSITCSSNRSGGISGALDNCTVTGCFSTCSVTGTANVGGFTGDVLVGGTITKCYASGAVSSTSGNAYAGGFCGLYNGTSISDCYSTGNVTAATVWLLGGFVGYIQGGTLSNCYSTGTVPASGINFWGGFSGYGTSSTNCFWDTETSGIATSSSGTGKTTAQMKTQSTFDPLWNFTTTWGMNSGINNGYPYLKSFYTLWTGSSSTDWNTAGNWSSGSVPTSLVANIYIPNVSPAPVVNQDPGSPAVCSNITIASGASLTIAPGKALTVYGTLTNNAGTGGLVIQSTS